MIVPITKLSAASEIDALLIDIAVGARLLAEEATVSGFVNPICPTPEFGLAASRVAAALTCDFKTSTLPKDPFAALDVSDVTP